MKHHTERGGNDSEDTTRTALAAPARAAPTNRDGSGLGTITTGLAVPLTIPLFMMIVVMPLAAVASGGAVMSGGPRMVVSPVPLAVLGVLVYMLYTYSSGGSAERDASPDEALAELRATYDRGDLSDEEFEWRRDRLRSDRREATRHE